MAEADAEAAITLTGKDFDRDRGHKAIEDSLKAAAFEFQSQYPDVGLDIKADTEAKSVLSLLFRALRNVRYSGWVGIRGELSLSLSSRLKSPSPHHTASDLP